MIDKDGKISLSKSRSMEDLELEPKSREEAKTRLNVTVLPKTSNWLKKGGNASHKIDELVEAAIAQDLKPTDHPLQKLEELSRENEQLKAELSQLQNQLAKKSSERRDYQLLRDKVLTGLKLGRQAPGYKSAVKALDRFITEMA